VDCLFVPVRAQFNLPALKELGLEAAHDGFEEMLTAFDNDNAIRFIFADRYELEEFCPNLQQFGFGFPFHLDDG